MHTGLDSSEKKSHAIDKEKVNADAWGRLRAAREMVERLPDMLGAIQDIIMPRGYEDIVDGKFQALLDRLPPPSTRA